MKKQESNGDSREGGRRWKIPGVVNRIFGVKNLVKPSMVQGELPSSRSAYGTALKIAAPAVAEMVFIALIGMADTVMVSSLGTYAIAAVGLTQQPRMMFMSIFMALNVGVTAIVSRRKGEGDRTSANLCVMQALIIAFLSSAVISVASIWMSGPLIMLAGGQEDTYLPAMQYLQVIGATLMLPALSMSITAAQRGVGDTKISFKINITANIVNVIFNFLLIEGRFGFPRLEVRGAAIATALGNLAGLIMAILSLSKKNGYLSVHQFGKPRFDPGMIKSMLKIGGNSVFEQICMRIGFFLFARIVADLGTFLYAAHLICMQMMTLTFTIGDGLAVASGALVGQSLGRGRPDLSAIYGKIGQRLALCASGVMLFVILILRYIFVDFYTDDPLLIKKAAETMIIMAFIQPIQTSHIVMAGSLRGAGDTRFVALTMMLTVALARPLLALTLMHPIGLGLTGAWIAMFIDQSMRLGLLYKRFSGGRWASIRI